MQTANDDVCIVVQAEHIDAVNNIEEIAGVSGIDAVLIGPYDLSASLGKMGQVDHPQVVEAIGRVAEVCSSMKMPLGIFGMSAEAVRPYRDRGFTLIVAGVDTVLLSAAAERLLGELKAPSRG
jgi:2-keto-3-deoxy-L-rhamnonate aldolase RhmA